MRQPTTPPEARHSSPPVQIQAAGRRRTCCRGIVLVAIVALGLGGCTARDVQTEYGRRAGSAGGKSVNGTGVLGTMFRRAGHRVATVRRVSPRLRQFDVIVWIPDDFYPPSVEQRVSLEQWLALGGKTLIYVGRDYDAAPHYWESILPLVPPTERPEVITRRAASRARHDNQRLNTPSEEFARWFHFQREWPPRQVTGLSSSAGWAEGVDTSRLDIRLETRLHPPTPGQEVAQTAASALVAGGARWRSRPRDDDWEFLDAEQATRQRQGPDQVEVLLASGDDALVTQLGDDTWLDSRILVVTNGSFLLNYGLLNREHRKLAGRLIDQCGTRRNVAFLETTLLDRLLHRRDEDYQHPTGLEAFTSWPLGFILMQAMLLGMVLCFVLFPIFGPPRQLESDGLTDFGKHVEAFGKLLERTRDESHARDLLREHLAGSRSDRADSADTST
jgi:hypothetical protein